MRRLDGFVALLVLLGLAGGAALLRDRAETLAGPVRVVDGDTIELAGRRIRLAGMDAPELDQICERGGRPWRCGEASRDALRLAVAAGEVTCAVRGRDRWGRGLGTCRSDAADLGRDLVRSGLAVSYGAYAAEEADARALRLGLWAGTFARPAEWRREHPR